MHLTSGGQRLLPNYLPMVFGGPFAGGVCRPETRGTLSAFLQTWSCAEVYVQHCALQVLTA